MRLIGSRSSKKTDIAPASGTGVLIPARPDSLVDWFRSFRRPAQFPGFKLPARPGLLVLTLILLVGLCAALASWGTRTSSDQTEVALLPGDSSPNLNSASAETHASSLAPQSGGEDHSQEEARLLSGVQPVSAPVPEPPITPPDLPSPKSVAPLPEPPALIVPSPVVELSKNSDPHPGEDPMMRTKTWNLFGLKTLLAAMLAASPSLAQQNAASPSQSDKLDEIQKQLDEIKKPLADLPKAIASLARVENELKDLRTEYLAGVQQEKGQLAELKKQIDQLRSDVEVLRNRESSVTRSSLFPPIESPPMAATGRVEIRNTYPQEVTVTVNNRAYRVPPGETVRSAPIPAGAFTYEVLGVTPVRTRNVTPGQNFQVHVHPQS
jgi:hypothetical protein